MPKAPWLVRGRVGIWTYAVGLLWCALTSSELSVSPWAQCPVADIVFLLYHGRLSVFMWRTAPIFRFLIWMEIARKKPQTTLKSTLTIPSPLAHGTPSTPALCLAGPFLSSGLLTIATLASPLLCNALIVNRIDLSQQSACCVCRASHLFTSLGETFGAQIAKHLNLKCLFLGWLLFSSNYQRNSGWSWRINHLSNFIS